MENMREMKKKFTVFGHCFKKLFIEIGKDCGYIWYII